MVVIRRAGNVIEIVPDLVNVLGPELTFTQRVQCSGNFREVEYNDVAVYRVENGKLFTNAGLTTRICNKLRSSNIPFMIEDMRQKRLPEPSLDMLEPLREKQDDVIARIIVSDGGIIEAPTGSGKSFMIRQICRMWYKCRIIICSPFTDVLKQIYQELLETLPSDQIGFVGAGRDQSDRRVVCCVDKSLRKCDLDNVDIFMFDEVHRAAAPGNKEVIARVHNARMYGFSASVNGRSDRGDLETEAMFGPIICQLSYQDVQKTGSIVPITAYVVDCSSVATVEAHTTTSLERNGLWRNYDRNHLISDVVDWVLSQYGQAIQILISVKTVEHAVYLSALLPSFTLVYASMSPEKRLMWERKKLIKTGEHPITSKQRDYYRNEFKAATLKRAIATGIWSTGVDFPQLNVLIRADGQSGPIQNTQIPGRVSRSAAGKEFGIVVDFDDCFEDTLKGRASRRMAMYRKKGWPTHRITLASLLTTNRVVTPPLV